LKVIKLSLTGLVCAISVFSQDTRPIRIVLDLVDAPRKILHAKISMPVQPGPITLVFPQWIPGEHGPTGPIDNFTGLLFTNKGQVIPWQRDDVNMYAFHLNVPAGVDTIEAKADFLATAAPTGFSAGASTTENLCVASWNEVLLYPADTPAREVTVEPSIKLPDGWSLGTALTRVSSDGNLIRFRPVPLDMLVDSPVLAARYFREIVLADEVTPKHYLDMAADGPEDLNISKDAIDSFSNLVRETGALYRSRHYNNYHFLVTLSDSVAHFGLEHHQSSDDRVEARNFLDEDASLLEGDLLPHEFTHSWNGKYRRPAGLVTSNYQQPMIGNLLWVYEGLTQYLGDVLAARSGIWTVDQYRSYLAYSAAEMDHRPGRTWRDLVDTARSAQILYDTSEQWDNWRRSVDYYQEGELIWLDVDTTIRKLSNGKRSLNDFCVRFLGLGGNTPPHVVPYTFEDVVNNLNAIQPHDWAGFLNERLTTKSPHAPLNGLTNGGYHIEYTSQPNDFMRARENHERGVDAWYSLGISEADNTIDDVLIESPAYKAGLGPGMKIIAINGRAASEDLLHDAIRNAQSSSEPIDFIVENTGFFRVLKIDYHGGERYPHLVRDEQAPDRLAAILKPMTNHPGTKHAE
jgi:predicted metalloprotease with PDZ domain